MTLIGATAAVQMPSEAAELAYRYIDASYRSTDSREPDEHGGLPGVTREYRRTITVGKWGEIDYMNAGIEGYGWGGLSIHLLIRYLLGLREEEAGALTVAPLLPQALRHAGAVYRVEPIQWGKYALSVECTVRDAEGYTLRVGCTTTEDTPSKREWQWDGKWGDERGIHLPR